MKNSIKKMVFIFLTVLIVVSIVSADEVVLFVGEGQTYDYTADEFLDTRYKMIFNTESEEYYFYTSDSLTSVWIIFNEDNAGKFRANLSKYKEWEKIAIGNKTKIEKSLPDSQIIGDVRWKNENGVHAGKNIAMGFTFLSQSETWHQLVLTSTTVDSTTNDYIFFLAPIYLASEQVTSMMESFSAESIQAKLDVYSELQ